MLLERAKLQIAVGAPMPAIERDDERAASAQIGAAHDLPRGVGQFEIGHGLAAPKRALRQSGSGKRRVACFDRRKGRGRLSPYMLGHGRQFGLKRHGDDSSRWW